MSALRLAGELGHDAEARTDAEGGAWLRLQVLQPGGVPALGAWRMGSGPSAALACTAKAKRLRRGARVIVHAASLQVGFHPTTHLQLHGVDLVEHAEAPAPADPPAEPSAAATRSAQAQALHATARALELHAAQLRLAVRLADRAVVADLTELADRVELDGRQWLDVAPLLDARLVSSEAIDMTRQALGYAVERGLVQLHPSRVNLAQLLRRP